MLTILWLFVLPVASGRFDAAEKLMQADTWLAPVKPMIDAVATKLLSREMGAAFRKVFRTGPARVLFLHVGKTGGSFMDGWLNLNNISFHQFHMNRPDPGIDTRQYERIVLWVRDPVARFESAFYYMKGIVLTNSTGTKKSAAVARAAPCESGPDCLESDRVRTQLLFGFAFDRITDQLLLQYDNASHLGEALSWCDTASEARRKDCRGAHTLLDGSHNPNHLAYGTGWYLHGLQFTPRQYQRMFVGSTEHMVEDLARLALELGVANPLGPTGHARENVNAHAVSRPMTALAVANLRAFYEKSPVSPDYPVMRQLVEYGLLDAGRYELGPQW